MSKYFPFLCWPRLTFSLFKSEIPAGLAVAWVVVPQALAYATLAGMPAITGIYMALLPALVAVLWGSSNRLATGPAALTCVLVGSAVQALPNSGAPMSDMWVHYVVWMGLMSGLIQLLFGSIKFGWFIHLVSSPVMTGFSQAAGLLIIASQLPSLFGVKLLSDIFDFTAINVWSLGFGCVSLIFLSISKFFSKSIPWIFVLMLCAAYGSYVTQYAQHSAVIGYLQTNLPVVIMPTMMTYDTFKLLFLPSCVIALISFLEAASSAKVDHQLAGTRWDDNQDLIGQGLAKCTAALLGAAPTSGSFSRSALNVYSGAKTGWATVFMVLCALLLWQLAAGVLAFVPKAVLSAVVIVAVIGLLKPAVFLRLWAMSKVEAIIAVLTGLVTLLSAPNLYWGVLVGVLLSLSHFLYQRLHPRIIEVGFHIDGSIRDRILWSLPTLGNHVFAIRMDAALDFASASSFERCIYLALSTRPNIKHVCVFAQSINWIDATGVETFATLFTHLQSKGITLHLSGLKLPIEQALQRSHALQDCAYLKCYRSETQTIQALKCL